jgi:monoterpene epsilon-lactone hydrolase
VSAAGLSAEWIEPPNMESGVILYLHGGCYALGSINSHRELISRIARSAKVCTLALNYRLAPENPCPAGLDDATSTYQWLITQGFDPSQIILAGDSAGGGLALAVLLALCDAGKTFPAGAVCISPWTDLAMTGASIQSKANFDCILNPGVLTNYAKAYSGEFDRTSPLISPFYADLKDLPPLLIQVGTDEVLLDDAVRFAQKAESAGVNVTLEIYNKMFHVFHTVPFLPETKRAPGKISEFVSKNIKNL